MLQRHPTLVEYAFVGTLVAIVGAVALLFLGPTVSQVFPDCSRPGSRPIGLHFGVDRAAACTRQGLPPDATQPEEGGPSPRPPQSPQGAFGGGLTSIGGQAWQYDNLCDAGTIFDLNLDEWVEVRMVLEFPIAAPPSGAPIRGASLSLYHESGNGLDQLALYGYAGNGAIEAADAVVTGVRIHFAAGMLGYSDHDVTALLTPGAVAGGWAGFSVRADPPVLVGSGSGQSWECVWAENYPVLTIEYETGP